MGLGRVVLLPTMWKRQKKSGAKSPPRQGNGGQALTPLWESTSMYSVGWCRRVGPQNLGDSTPNRRSCKIPATLARMACENVPESCFLHLVPLPPPQYSGVIL